MNFKILSSIVVVMAMIIAGVTTLNAKNEKTVASKFYNTLKQKVEEKVPASGNEIFKKDHPNEFRDGMPEKLARLDEVEYQNIKRDVTYPLGKIIRNGNFGDLKKLGLPDNSGFDASINSELLRQNNGIEEYNWKFNGSDKNSFVAQRKNYKTIDDVELFGYSVKSHKAQRSKESYGMEKAEVLARFDIRGTNKQGNRQNDRGIMKLVVEKKGNSWKLNDVRIINGESLIASRKPVFQNITASAIPEVKTYIRGEAIRRGGYALSTTDFNGDGNADIFVGAMGKSQLFMGNGKGKFTEVKNSGLKGESLVKAAIFGDFFNTGNRDLLMVRFAPNQERVKFGDIVMYKNLGNNKFEQAYEVRNREKSDYAMPAAVADFNRDGYLDFYVGFPGPRDFTFLQGQLGVDGADKIAVEGLFMNDKKGAFVRSDSFSKTSKVSMLNAPGYTGDQVLAPHSALAADYDKDGDMDIFVVDDRGNMSPIYKNDGSGNFVQVAEKIGLGNFQYGMGNALGDIDGDGELDAALTNVNFNSALRMNNSGHINYGIEPLKTGLNGLRLAKGRKGTFSDITNVAGLTWPGEGVAGVEFIDYNNDGHLDIYVANGLWSGTEREQDISSLYSRYVMKYGEASSDVMNELDVMQDLLTTEHEVAEMYTDARSHFMNVLGTYKGDVLDENSNKRERPSLAGFQRNRLYRNNGNGTFTEVGYLEGVDSIADGYIIGKADFNNDGKMDMILRNGDPGSHDAKFSPVEIYINNSKDANSVMLTLKSTKSNTDAIGSIIEAKIGSRTLTRHLMANNGTAQSQHIVHFGLGDKQKIDALTVRWPSGKVETHRNIKKGRHNIVEGAAVESVASSQ